MGKDLTEILEARLKDDGYGFTLSSSEVCEVLSIHRSTLYKLCREEKLEVVKLDRDHRYPRHCVARFMSLGMR